MQRVLSAPEATALATPTSNMTAANSPTLEAQPSQSNPLDTPTNEVSSVDAPCLLNVRLIFGPKRVLAQREVQTAQVRPKRRRSSVASSTTDDTPGNECMTLTPEPVAATEKRTRGPSKKTRIETPACEARFLSIYEPLRKETSRALQVDMAVDAYKLYEAFEAETLDMPNDAEEGSVVGKIRQRIEFCELLKRRGSSMVIRGNVQERFELVILAYEYRKATAHLSQRAAQDKRRGFIAELFPGKDPSQTPWQYYWQVGKPLLRLVERYGWGALVFPTLNMTKKRFVITALGNSLAYPLNLPVYKTFIVAP